jgi:hypothetical protein
MGRGTVEDEPLWDDEIEVLREVMESTATAARAVANLAGEEKRSHLLSLAHRLDVWLEDERRRDPLDEKEEAIALLDAHNLLPEATYELRRVFSQWSGASVGSGELPDNREAINAFLAAVRRIQREPKRESGA